MAKQKVLEACQGFARLYFLGGKSLRRQRMPFVQEPNLQNTSLDQKKASITNFADVAPQLSVLVSERTKTFCPFGVTFNLLMHFPQQFHDAKLGRLLC